jgi:hypothetical protein
MPPPGHHSQKNAAAQISWEATVAALSSHLDGMQKDETGVYQTTEALCKTFAALVGQDWDNEQRVFTFGQLDAEKLVPFCRAGLLPWWQPFTGHAFFGDLDGIRLLHAAYTEEPGKSEKPSPDSALTWISHPYELGRKAANKIVPAVLEQLMDWGADPNHSDGKWLMMGLRQLEPAQLRPFLDHGADLLYIGTVLQKARANGEDGVLRNVTAALPGRVYYNKVDDDSLLETRFLPGAAGLSSLKTLFNFKSRRVTEIHESAAPEASVQTVAPFSDFDTAVLQEAAARLAGLGGRKDALTRALDKPLAVKKPRLASSPA